MSVCKMTQTKDFEAYREHLKARKQRTLKHIEDIYAKIETQLYIDEATNDSQHFVDFGSKIDLLLRTAEEVETSICPSELNGIKI